jgi:hypothetical protein
MSTKAPYVVLSSSSLTEDLLRFKSEVVEGHASLIARKTGMVASLNWNGSFLVNMSYN